MSNDSALLFRLIHGGKASSIKPRARQYGQSHQQVVLGFSFLYFPGLDYEPGPMPIWHLQGKTVKP